METYYGYVKAPQDAIILFEACRMGFLNRIQRRLSEKERSQIRSGSVFVWDEREAGMRRWTDGKSWSASRVSGSFLTYRELESKRKSGSRGSNNLNDLSSEDTDSTKFIQPGGNDSSGYVGSAPINIPNGRYTFPQPQQLSFPSSYPPPTQLPPQDIRWDNTRNSEDQRQLNAIYTTLRL
ncbi:3523_t:CDS:2 [Paraglomus occultum]|uniref:3523_t:CDS:1 n=1 Tax=Paraglomus occultum TaxID=144539 RepID=A0A9N9AMK6_9GLOM|nr:3523_t:CDS:2 [Paraglomus occultum]